MIGGVLRKVAAGARSAGAASRRRAPALVVAFTLAAGTVGSGVAVSAWGARTHGAKSVVSAKGMIARAGVAQAQAPSARPALPAAGPPERGFSHRRHRAVECTSCHLSAQSHGALKVRTRDDCTACHHSPRRSAGCSHCHEASELAQSGRTVRIRTSVSKAVNERVLPFAHSLHGELSCGDCHGAGPDHRPRTDCAACHDRHHTEARDCQRCHRPGDVKAHPTSDVHAGCGGAGCHADRAVTSLRWSRNVCVACHQDRAKHEAGRDCATCHQVPALHANPKEVAP